MAEKYIPFFVPTIGNEEIREVANVAAELMKV